MQLRSTEQKKGPLWNDKRIKCVIIIFRRKPPKY